MAEPPLRLALLPFVRAPPFAAQLRLTPELRAALLAHACTGGATVTFLAGGTGAVRCSAAGRDTRSLAAMLNSTGDLRSWNQIPLRLIPRARGNL